MAQSPRIIQPGDVQDERVARLPLSAAYTYAYLPTVLDDDGRAVDQPAVVNGRLWALRFDEHPTDAMAADLEALAGEGLICRYTVDGQGYLHDPAWRRRQKLVRPVRSALPRCPIHDSGIREFVGDTFTTVSDQVSSFLGGAVANAGTTKVRDTVARIVEDVTFPVDPDKAAAYGQRIRDFLGGATGSGASGRPGGAAPSEPFPVAGTVPAPGTVPGSAETAPEVDDEVEYDSSGTVVDGGEGAPSAGDEPGPDGDGSPSAESEPSAEGEPSAVVDEDGPGREPTTGSPGDVWREATDDPSPDR